MDANAFDAVVIGSGLGGLTAAALLAKAGRSVCVIERNHSLGGAASVFKSGALTIEPSLHQTADPRDPNDPKHEILASLGVLDEIEWVPVSPFLSVRGGPVGETFDLPVGLEAAHEAMESRFPESAHGIDRLFRMLETTAAGVADLNRARSERSVGRLLRGAIECRSLISEWRASLDDVLQRTLGDNEAAKCAFAGNLSYYADDPRELWWTFFALAQGGYLGSGGVYVKGGSHALSMKLAKIVTRAGGRVLLGREAVGIDDAAGRPAFVRHADAKTGGSLERVGAKCVFANCAPDILAGLLAEPLRDAVEAAYRGRAISTSLFTAHFGLAAPPAKFGLERFGMSVLPEWMTSLRDTAESATVFADDPKGRMPAFGIANYGAIDSGLDDGGPVLVTVVGLDRLSNWEGLTPEQEKERRHRWLDAFQAALDHDYPGFGSAVTERLFLNARSMRNFLNTPGGAVYGFAQTPPRRGILARMPRSARTPIPNVYLASSFGGGGGYTGAILSGANAARLAMAQGKV